MSCNWLPDCDELEEPLAPELSEIPLWGTGEAIPSSEGSGYRSAILEIVLIQQYTQVRHNDKQGERLEMAV